MILKLKYQDLIDYMISFQTLYKILTFHKKNDKPNEAEEGFSID